MTPDQVQRLHYAALDVVANPTFHTVSGRIVVVIPHDIWTRLEAVIDALPHPTSAADPAATPDAR